MTNQQIRNAIAVSRSMLGEVVSKMNPLASDDCPVNQFLLQEHDRLQAEIDRLRITMNVRECAATMRAGV